MRFIARKLLGDRCAISFMQGLVWAVHLGGSSRGERERRPWRCGAAAPQHCRERLVGGAAQAADPECALESPGAAAAVVAAAAPCEAAAARKPCGSPDRQTRAGRELSTSHSYVHS